MQHPKINPGSAPEYYHPPKTQTHQNWSQSKSRKYNRHLTKSWKVQRIPNFYSKSSLKLNSVSELDVKKEILNLSSKRATGKDNIPAKILKNRINAYLLELKILINNCLEKGVFPYDLELSDITPIFKKENSLNKENYRPVSILPHLSKVFERILYKQINSFMKDNFSPYLCVLPIRQWSKSRSNLHGPFKSFWHNQSQLTIGKTKSVWFF